MKLVVNGAEIEVDDRHAKTPLLWEPTPKVA
jgi:hypothetical protein